MTDSKLAVLTAILDRPIAFHVALARICGAAIDGLFLSQAMYWTPRTKDCDGWFYKSAAEWQVETCLSRREVDGIRRRLVRRGFIESKVRGVPPTCHYRVNLAVIYEAVAMLDPIAPKRQIDRTKTPNRLHQSAKSYKESETTTETTQRLNPPNPLLQRGKLKIPTRKRDNLRIEQEVRRLMDQFIADGGSQEGADKFFDQIVSTAAVNLGYDPQYFDYRPMAGECPIHLNSGATQSGRCWGCYATKYESGCQSA